ncbi:MAG: molybdopterin-dependent oxidoreductase [bacterium]|nr:molybdopterin-dependent oxidoreductase [bacterium]MCP5068063.1 molybdopterin-dependent oxidoreductase [bacterium]
MVHIRVDGTAYEVREGLTLLQALDDLGVLMKGVDIPHYCWHPKLSIDGSCRMCQVEVEGMPKLQIACGTPVRDGMIIHTRSERALAAREGVMELLLVNHPLDCPICDQAGECKLQDYAFEYGQAHSRTREPRRALKKRVELGSTIILDQERCILCRRCVRFCREVSATNELAVTQRGDRSTIETFPGKPLENDYSMNVADLCPVGALTTRDFRFKTRVWSLEEVPGICTGCSRGCNVHVGVVDHEVRRYTPRRNDEVNGTWLCDQGRMTYREIGAPDRITEPAVRGNSGQLVGATLDRAIGRAVELIREAVQKEGPGVVAALASAHATNEDLAALRGLLRALGSETHAAPVLTGSSDALLVRPEKAANAEGARVAGFGEPGLLFDKIRGGGVRVLIVLGHDVIHEQFLGTPEPLAALDGVILLDTHRSRLEQVADVVIPGRHLAEKGGSVTNHAGLVQAVPAALEPTFEAIAEAQVLARFADALDVSLTDEPERKREVD